MSYYCTLAQARAEIKATDQTDDTLVMGYIRTVSRRLDRILDRLERPYFEPSIELRSFLVLPEDVDSAINGLYLADPLLEVTSISRSGVSLTFGTDVLAHPSTTRRPFRVLRLSGFSRSWYDTVSENYPYPLVDIDGTWGYHDDYARAWQSATTLAANATSSATTITLTAVVGSGYSEVFPISGGHLLKIDSEFIRVLSVNTSNQVVTVVRGANGSTAASHTSGATVSVWDTPIDVRHETARQVGLLYTRRGAFDQVAQNEIGTVVSYPQDLLRSLEAVAYSYMGSVY
jgi:hypothetical protein